jgi:hypothetical protein
MTLELWSHPITLSVEIGNPSAAQPPTELIWLQGNDVVYVSVWQDGAVRQRMLVIQGVAELHAGYPPSTTCEMLGDASTAIKPFFALPVSYLARAVPAGPFSLAVGSSSTVEFEVEPEAVYLDPGSFMQRAQAAIVQATVRRQTAASLTFSLRESPVNRPPKSEVQYSGLWSVALEGALPEDSELLAEWLVCPYGKVSVAGARTIGDLRTLRASAS